MPNLKNRKLLSDLDKVILYYPSMHTLKVSPDHFKLLLDSITPSIRERYSKRIPYNGKTIEMLIR